MRKKLIAANWKMNKTRREAADFARSLTERIGDFSHKIALFPPFTAIETVAKEAENSKLIVGAQDVFYERKGPYTGEVSCEMLSNLGCEMVIAGHSERRHFFGESDEVVAAKTRAVLNNGMSVVLCVGETEKQRSDGVQNDVVRSQLAASLAAVDSQKITVAYEPVWAIGTGRNAGPEQIGDMHAFIRKELSVLLGETSEQIRIIYGGSINPSNAAEISRTENVDGMLVGTASLELESFVGIIEGSVD